jgi:purine-nucleoside phosphorylase
LTLGFPARLEAAHASVAARAPGPVRVGVVLGSGLGEFARSFGGTEIDYSSIPDFPVPTVAGHSGVLRLRGSVALFAGRFHHYEGFSPDDVVMPVCLARRLGATTIVLTNAAGAIRREIEPGSLVLIRDHINLMGMNPLRGPHLPGFGPRFPDMSSVYSVRLRELARRVAGASLGLVEGVYAALAGPCYETPAEIRMLEAMGADLVGMSTVPEAIAACSLGTEVLGLSCVTNMAAGVLDKPLDHEEVLATGRAVAPRFAALLDALLAELGT